MHKKLTIILIFFSLFGYSAVKTSISNGNWSNASTWSPSGVPISNDKIYINHDITLDISFQAADTVFVKGVLNLFNNSVLNFNSVGTLIIVGNSSFSGRIGTVGNNANIVGNFTLQKWVDHCDNTWSTFSTPFNVTLNSYNFLYTGFVGGYYYPSYDYINAYLFQEPIPGGYIAPVSTSQIIPRGTGFFYWYSSQTIGAGSPSTTITYWDFPRTISLNGSLDFTTDYNFQITNTATSGNSGFNLVGNPYPGTIDWLANGGAWSKSNINSTLYTWNSCTGVYASYNSGVGVNGGTRYITPMQGFFVQSNNPGASLNCNHKVLVDQNTALLKTSFNIPDTIIHNVLKINLGNDEIAIRLDSTSTLNTDSLTDSELYIGDSTRLYSYNYSYIKNYSINAVKDTNQTIPVSIKKGGTLTFNGLNTFKDYSISLKDLVSNITYPIYEGFQYTFIDTSLVTYNTRFEINFTKSVATGIKQNVLNNVGIFYDETNIYINKEIGASVVICDLLGRELYRAYEVGNMIIKRFDVPVIVYVISEGIIKTYKIF